MTFDPRSTVKTPAGVTLRKYLNLHWLRPENGLLCAFKSQAFSDVDFLNPSLDISCGDGLFLLLHLGGELSSETDYYLSTRAKEFKHDRFIDIYDSYDTSYKPAVVRQPDVRFDVGTDWKQALLDKASHLSLFDDLLLHDNNVVPMPFEDERFSTIYSNSVYWVADVDALVRDIHRMLAPGGLAVLEMATPTLLETLDQVQGLLGSKATVILDRSRRATMVGFRRPSEWMQVFESSGFTVEDARCVYPDKLITHIWNVGLRPVSHLLIQMAEHLPTADRQAIKAEWVDIFHTLLEPLLDLPVTYESEQAPYICYILRK